MKQPLLVRRTILCLLPFVGVWVCYSEADAGVGGIGVEELVLPLKAALRARPRAEVSAKTAEILKRQEIRLQSAERLTAGPKTEEIAALSWEVADGATKARLNKAAL